MTFIKLHKLHFQTYLPSGLFVIVAWLSLFLPPESIPGRVIILVDTISNNIISISININIISNNIIITSNNLTSISINIISININIISINIISINISSINIISLRINIISRIIIRIAPFLSPLCPPNLPQIDDFTICCPKLY